jgi:hypothetical protein
VIRLSCSAAPWPGQLKRYAVSPLLMIKKLIIVGCLSCLMGVGYFLYRHPIILKAATGTARVLSSTASVTIKIDGQIDRSAKCFFSKSRFDGKPADDLVLWLPNVDAHYGRNVLIVDRLNGNVGLPNTGELDYYLLWNRFLFQSETGSGWVGFKDAKLDKQDPHLELSDSHVTFVVPPSSPVEVISGHKIEIVFNS